jgi:hypothetical protein
VRRHNVLKSTANDAEKAALQLIAKARGWSEAETVRRLIEEEAKRTGLWEVACKAVLPQHPLEHFEYFGGGQG